MASANKIEFYSFGTEDDGKKKDKPPSPPAAVDTDKTASETVTDQTPGPSQPSQSSHPSTSRVGSERPVRLPTRTSGPPLFSDGVTSVHPAPAPNLILDQNQPKAKSWLSKLGLVAFPEGYIMVGVKRQKDETKVDGYLYGHPRY
ncbi:hypothetical protein HK097_004392 [Rhizophlyctis rosea]|uniref:Uncharacterized protein n=1 Tax=Rhizophlyctis rosea TaxID=64517 RepID=A0AAD5S2H1_9FUNG|nr:hypothetical protein HK097_004392 [Rhizophlyctis rosea]